MPRPFERSTPRALRDQTVYEGLRMDSPHGCVTVVEQLADGSVIAVKREGSSKTYTIHPTDYVTPIK